MLSLVEKHRPRKIADFAGLTGPRSILQAFLRAPYPSAWLFVGPAGTGKTTMAYALAEELSGEIHHIASRACDLETVETLAKKCHYYPWSGDWHIAIVDEADQMTKAAQVAFLSKLDSTEAPPQTIFLFTANDTRGLEARFLSRTRAIQFSLESDQDAAISHLERIWHAETQAAPPNLEKLFTAADYNLRSAIMDMELMLIVARTAAADTPPPREMPAVVAINDLDNLGVRALRLLCKQRNVSIGSRKQDTLAHLRAAAAM